MAVTTSTGSGAATDADGSDPARPAGLTASPAAAADTLVAHVWSHGSLRVVHELSEVQAALDDEESRLWVDVQDAAAETLTELAAIFGLHHLVAEDIIERNQRAKIVYWDGSLHLVLFALHHHGTLTSSEVDVVLGPRFLITSHPPEWQPSAALDGDARSVGPLDRPRDGPAPVRPRRRDRGWLLPGHRPHQR